MKLNLTFFFPLFLSFNLATASDHIDGVPSLTLHQQVDLTDLYVFQNGQDKRKVSLVLNLYPGVSETGHFSSKVFYNIKIRPVYLNSPAEALVTTETQQEAVITCSFTDPGHHHGDESNEKSQANCLTMMGRAVASNVTGPVGEIVTSANESMKMFTGPRSDPFFLTREHFDAVTQRQGFIDPVFDNLMETINVLSIVLEIDMDKIFPDYQGEYFSVAAESLTEVDGQVKVLDRVGRPEIT
ncbi:MAG: DUF4331 family protein, partial [Bdellovibrionales bacterium]|nr:DUF4331 domain-containing protein [Bdellovibrionales bacterium]NQZ20413.1 DUF4331 family protein [Bdellovibrionales bacterium]